MHVERLRSLELRVRRGESSGTTSLNRRDRAILLSP